MTTVKFSRVAKSLLGAAVLIGAATVSQAHHSFAAQYDSNKPTSMSGVVTKVEWTNPHVYIYIDVTDPKTQKVSNWGFEMGPPHMLMRTGWKRNSLKIGEEVAVDGWLARDGSSTANARRVTRKSNGEVMGAASSNNQTLGSNTGTQAQ